MALQGTLETFSVPEVLRLLSGTKKTGLLALEGDRGTGRVWVRDGRITSAGSDHEQGDRIEAVLFDLLRYDRGSFHFDSDAQTDELVDHDADVETLLADAEELLEQWRAIESVVPSLDVHVQLVDELDGDAVTVTADQWRTLAAIGGGTTARRLGARFELGEFDACGLVRDLVGAGLVQVHEAAPESTPDAPVYPEPDHEPARTVDHDLSTDEVASLGANLAGFVATPTDDAVEGDAEPVVQGRHELVSDDVELDAPFADDVVDLGDAALDTVEDDEPVSEWESEPAPAVEAGETGEPEADTDDFLSQLSNLSPKAAAAIEATAETSDDRPAADEPADAGNADGDEEINRNLLLKFLSSAKN